jgi:hypothetical protein
VRRPRRGRLPALVLGLALLALALAAATSGMAANPTGSGSGVRDAGVSSGGATVSAKVYFNGELTTGHTSTSSAIPASFAHTFRASIDWTATGGTAFVTQGQLSILFLGITVGTSAESLVGATPATAGNVSLNTTNFAQNQYLFEGVYQLQASLFDNGTLLFQQTFYVWIQATDHLTVVNVALVLIGVWEIYQFAMLGSVRAARKELGLTPPSGTPSSAPPPPPEAK